MKKLTKLIKLDNLSLDTYQDQFTHYLTGEGNFENNDHIVYFDFKFNESIESVSFLSLFHFEDGIEEDSEDLSEEEVKEINEMLTKELVGVEEFELYM